MAELLPEDLRDRVHSLSDTGNCYLAEDDGTEYGDTRYVRYVDDRLNLSDEDLGRVWLSPNGFEPSSSVGRANKASFLEAFGDRPGIIQTAFMGLALRVADITEDMMEVLVTLTQYPVIDDLKVAEEQSNSQREAWDQWVRRDFERAIEKVVLADCELVESVEIDSDEADQDKWFRFFCDRLNNAGDGWIEESDGGWCVSVEAAAKSITLKDLTELRVRANIYYHEA